MTGGKSLEMTGGKSLEMTGGKSIEMTVKHTNLNNKGTQLKHTIEI